MSQPKIQKIAIAALKFVRAGARPDVAWHEALKEIYPKGKRESQFKHTCPKWAFCILCHKGHVKHVKAGCCPKSESSSSAHYTLKAFEQLAADSSLLKNKRELKERVFGRKGEAVYRQPNDEVEVLLYLRDAGEI